MNKLSVKFICLTLMSVVIHSGCASSRSGNKFSFFKKVEDKTEITESESSQDLSTIKQVSLEIEETEKEALPGDIESGDIEKNSGLFDDINPELLLPEQLDKLKTPLKLEDVISSIYSSNPMVESVLYSRDIASGNNLSAHGAFDLKLKASSENGPQGFYQTYRQSIGLTQPLYSGSEVWGGYRVGRGDFQPWYRERQTNDGGEFKAGMTIPLMRNRDIDERRTELWKSELDMQLAEFDIQAQMIGFVQEASYAYWEWIAAGKKYDIAKKILELAESRNSRIKSQVEAGSTDPPELTDNLRLIAERRAKLADAERKLNQKASKLSLYIRDAQGFPLIPSAVNLSVFPEPYLIEPKKMREDVQIAMENRPELKIFDLFKQQYDVDLTQANNLLKPDVSAVIWGSQDMGQPTSPKRDKSEYEMEASLYLDVPIQRRKARGKIRATQAKIHQLLAKRHLTMDKIDIEVQTAYAALIATHEQVQQTREAVKLAGNLAQIERENKEAGLSDMLKVTLREQYAVESAVKEVDALLMYHQAQADYQAALANSPSP